MMQFQLSKILTKDLGIHVQASMDIVPSALQWYGHRVTIERRKCVIMMEEQSRYAMVFCGLKKRDFEDFPALFQNRLLREVGIIAQLEAPLPESDLALLNDLLLDISAEEIFQPGHNRSVTTHINQVRSHLEMMVYGEGYPLPVSPEEAFHFGIMTNDILRKRQADKDYFYPVRVFHEFWLGLLECAKKTVKQKNTATAKPESGKVIWGYFGSNEE